MSTPCKFLESYSREELLLYIDTQRKKRLDELATHSALEAKHKALEAKHKIALRDIKAASEENAALHSDIEAVRKDKSALRNGAQAAEEEIADLRAGLEAAQKKSDTYLRDKEAGLEEIASLRAKLEAASRANAAPPARRQNTRAAYPSRKSSRKASGSSRASAQQQAGPSRASQSSRAITPPRAEPRLPLPGPGLDDELSDLDEAVEGVQDARQEDEEMPEADEVEIVLHAEAFQANAQAAGAAPAGQAPAVEQEHWHALANLAATAPTTEEATKRPSIEQMREQTRLIKPAMDAIEVIRDKRRSQTEFEALLRGEYAWAARQAFGKWHSALVQPAGRPSAVAPPVKEKKLQEWEEARTEWGAAVVGILELLYELDPNTNPKKSIHLVRINGSSEDRRKTLRGSQQYVGRG